MNPFFTFNNLKNIRKYICVLGLSREPGPVGCLYIQEAISYKELGPVVMKSGKSITCMVGCRLETQESRYSSLSLKTVC